MIPAPERTLLQVWWTDCTNVAGGWHDGEDLAHFATNGAWECSNTGWLVYEDEKCYVLAGRMTDDGRNVGLVERIPKSAVTRTVVHQPSPAQAPAGSHGTTNYPLVKQPKGGAVVAIPPGVQHAWLHRLDNAAGDVSYAVE